MKVVIAIVVMLAAGGFGAVALLPDSDGTSPISAGSVYAVTRGELLVTVTEQGTLESSNNTEIKCRVRGDSTITFVIESGTEVKQGDILVELETLAIEEEISERTKFYHLANSQVARSRADVARAKLAISEYEEGRFVSELAALQKDLAIAESRLLNTKNRLNHSQMMAQSEYASELEVEEKEFAVAQAILNVNLTKTQIEVLENFTKREELVRLRGELKAAEATYKADVERALADKKRLERAQEELGFCTIVADRAGIVIYPTGEEWKNAPEIEEGSTVHKDQVLLLMPDLKQMQVKVGIHESMVDRIHARMEANVTLNRIEMKGEVSSVASVAKPAGWWTGNVVKYDTIVALSQSEGLRPGMSVEVEIVIARYDDVLTVPATAVLETQQGHSCWVHSKESLERRSVKLGDHSEMFIAIEEGLQEGETVVLDPLANVEEAQFEAALLLEASKKNESPLDDL